MKNYLEVPSFQDAFRANFRYFRLNVKHTWKQVYSCISEVIGSLDIVHLILCMLSTYFISYDIFWELFRENASWNITFAGRGLSGLRGQFTWGSCREFLQPLKKKTDEQNTTYKTSKQKKTTSSPKNIFNNEKSQFRKLFLGNMMSCLW